MRGCRLLFWRDPLIIKHRFKQMRKGFSVINAFWCFEQSATTVSELCLFKSFLCCQPLLSVCSPSHSFSPRSSPKRPTSALQSMSNSWLDVTSPAPSFVTCTAESPLPVRVIAGRGGTPLPAISPSIFGALCVQLLHESEGEHTHLALICH